MSSMTLFGDGKVFPRHQLASDLQDMRPLLGTLRYNLHDFGRIVSSNTRSCVEDMTTRRLGLYLRPTAVRVRYSSCRYNERQLIDVTVVRRARPRAECWCDCEGHRRWCPLYICSFLFCNTPPTCNHHHCIDTPPLHRKEGGRRAVGYRKVA